MRSKCFYVLPGNTILHFRPVFHPITAFLRKNEAELFSVLSKKHFFSPQATAPTSAYRRANGLSAAFGNGHPPPFFPQNGNGYCKKPDDTMPGKCRKSLTHPSPTSARYFPP